MVTADQLVAHVVGDYLLQSDWMAREKGRRWLPAAVHAILYAVPFVLLGPSLKGWLAIAASHFVLDRWRVARFVSWLGGRLGPLAGWTAGPMDERLAAHHRRQHAACADQCLGTETMVIRV
jgi:Protein of unknown function (DUF3307)